MDNKALAAFIKGKMKKESPKRLDSLRLPRDLSLGGTKSRKVYVPNINVARNKDKSKENVKEQLQKLERKRRENLDKKSNRYVQSAGVFSEGSAKSLKQSYSENRGQRGDGAAVANMQAPTYKKEKLQVDKDKDDVVLSELIDRDDEEDDEKNPVMPVTFNPQHSENKSTVPINFIKPSSDDACLSLIQLPDSLCGKGLSDDPKVKKIFDYPLKAMLEGQIGTLQIRKSQKMYIKIGDTLYHLDPIYDRFRKNKELVMYTESSSDSHFSILGNIYQEFIMSPTWDQLLNK